MKAQNTSKQLRNARKASVTLLWRKQCCPVFSCILSPRRSSPHTVARKLHSHWSYPAGAHEDSSPSSPLSRNSSESPSSPPTPPLDTCTNTETNIHKHLYQHKNDNSRPRLLLFKDFRCSFSMIPIGKKNIHSISIRKNICDHEITHPCRIKVLFSLLFV